jgi:tRNA(Ile)-lysidine synthase TilS/MesJ
VFTGNPVACRGFMLYLTRYGFVHCIRKAGYRHPRLRGTKQEAIQCTRMDCFTAFAKTEGVAVIVIARHEAIQCTRMDCFTLFAMTEGVAVIVIARYEAIRRMRMDCFTAFAMTEGVTAIVIARHEAIQCTRIDCFTLFAMTEGVAVIVIARGCEARSNDGEKQCTKLPRAKGCNSNCRTRHCEPAG